MTTLAFVGGIPGGWELFVVLFIALLLFGKRLPRMISDVGKSIGEFRKGVKAGEEDEVTHG